MSSGPPPRPHAPGRSEKDGRLLGPEVSLCDAEEARVTTTGPVIAVMTAIQVVVGTGLAAGACYLLWRLAGVLMR